MNRTLEQRIRELERKVAALEGQIQAQSNTLKIDLTKDTENSKFVDYLTKCIINYQYQMSKQSH